MAFKVKKKPDHHLLLSDFRKIFHRFRGNKVFYIQKQAKITKRGVVTRKKYVFFPPSYNGAAAINKP